MSIKILFAAMLTLASLTAGHAQTLDKGKLDRFFNRLAEKNKAMGSLTIAKDGQILYTRAIGYSQINGTGKKPSTAANRFRIGSITKTFTATMILQLVDERKLKLTDTIDKFVPQIPTFETITVSPETLEKYVGIYSSRDVPVKFTVTREGSTLFLRPGNQSGGPLEATGENKFQILGGRVTFEFDPAKKQMIHRRGGPSRVFTKEE